MTAAPPLLDLKAAALEYAARGWRIVPLHSLSDGACSCGRGNCSSGGKHPRIKDWPRNASSEETQVAQWWYQWPAANVGIALGTLSGLVGVDVDSEHAEAKLLEMAGNDGLPATLEMTTSAGKRRLLFAIPDSLETEPQTTAIPLPGGELRLQSTGGQCVMPPSLHPSGVRYAWCEGRSPSEIEAAPMPGWLVAAMMPAPKAEPQPVPAANGQPRKSTGDTPEIVTNFNRDADWMTDILFPKGWTVDRARADGVVQVCRPGKDGGCSATIGHYKAADGSPALFIFTGSVPELAPNHAFDKFGAYAKLFHGGSHREAIRGLAATGRFGKLAKAKAERNGHANGEALPAAADPAPWGDFIPLDDLCEVPTFPMHCLPQPLVDLILSAAEAVGCPADYGAVHALGIAGGVIGGAFDMQVKRGHWQTSNLWVCVVAPPGSGKSPAVAPLLAPVYAEQARRAAAGDKRPVYVSDVTIEKLSQFLQEQPRGVLMVWDEMAGWLNSFNQYKAKGGGNDRTHYLSIWDGRALKVDRKTGDSPPVFVRYPRLSLVGGIQPEVLDGLRAGPSDGLFDRMLFSYPTDLGLATETFSEINHAAESAWASALRKLWDLPEHTEELAGKPRPGRIKLNDDGRPVWQAWTRELHDRAGLDDAPTYFRQVAAKSQGYAARIALVVHLLHEAYGLSSSFGVGERAMQRGVDIARYFLAHADRVYRSAGRDEKVATAKAVLSWLAKRKGETFTRSDAWASLRRNSLFSEPNDLREPLRLLGVHRAIRWIDSSRQGPGRPSEGAYAVNPALFGRVESDQ